MASTRRRKKPSYRNKVSSAPPPPMGPIKKSQSAPNGIREVDWPGTIDDKYIEDVRNRLNVIEQNAVSDDMIRCFLAAHDSRQRDAVEALKKTVEWRKGRQMFWNHYRSQNERFQFLSQIRRVGTGFAGTFGRTNKGRLVFYEKMGQNFNMALHSEFSESEFIDHVVVWAENLLNAALANCGRAIHLIHDIPFYQHEEPPNTTPDTETAPTSQQTVSLKLFPECARNIRFCEISIFCHWILTENEMECFGFKLFPECSRNILGTAFSTKK